MSVDMNAVEQYMAARKQGLPFAPVAAVSHTLNGRIPDGDMRAGATDWFTRNTVPLGVKRTISQIAYGQSQQTSGKVEAFALEGPAQEGAKEESPLGPAPVGGVVTPVEIAVSGASAAASVRTTDNIARSAAQQPPTGESNAQSKMPYGAELSPQMATKIMGLPADTPVNGGRGAISSRFNAITASLKF